MLNADSVLFNGLDPSERGDMQVFDRLYKFHGPLRSTSRMSAQGKQDAELHFHFREKAECALTVCSSWYGGDYFEFGSHDLNTFRNMLTAYDLSGMSRAYQDVRFYAFDVFGKMDDPSDADLRQYFEPYSSQGDRLEQHHGYVRSHGLFTDRCELVQGLFSDTLTAERKAAYLAEGRKIGFAFLDCNIGSSYRTVFEFIFGMMGDHSYIYMDEYLQNPDVVSQFEQFTADLRKERNMGALYVRNAGGFGALFRLYPIQKLADPLRYL